jgi:hypothetical protein
VTSDKAFSVGLEVGLEVGLDLRVVGQLGN